MHARLVEGVTPFNGALSMQDVASNLNLATGESGKAMLDGKMITQQAALIGYLNDFTLLIMYLTLLMVPLVLLIGRRQEVRRAGNQAGRSHPRDGFSAITFRIPPAPSRYARRARHRAVAARLARIGAGAG